MFEGKDNAYVAVDAHHQTNTSKDVLCLIRRNTVLRPLFVGGGVDVDIHMQLLRDLPEL
jgi:hypothetical protein